MQSTARRSGGSFGRGFYVNQATVVTTVNEYNASDADNEEEVSLPTLNLLNTY